MAFILIMRQCRVSALRAYTCIYNFYIVLNMISFLFSEATTQDFLGPKCRCGAQIDHCWAPTYECLGLTRWGQRFSGGEESEGTEQERVPIAEEVLPIPASASNSIER